MAKVHIRMGGYGPPTTTHSRALRFIADALEAECGDAVDVKIIWNIMDFGYRGEDTLWMAEHGILTLVYQSTSYLTDRVPELGFLDLPFLFASNEHARAAMDGALGRRMTEAVEEKTDYRVLGFLENGFRHISNRLRPVHVPADLGGMRIRVLPSRVHARTFELLGCEALRIDLTEAIEGVVNGTLDAQENPFANTVTYGVHKHHRYHTKSSHFYLSRGLFAHRPAIDGLASEIRAALEKAVVGAVAYQRDLAVAEEDLARKTIEDAGGEVVELTSDERGQFVDAVQPLLQEARVEYGDQLFGLVGASET